MSFNASGKIYNIITSSAAFAYSDFQLINLTPDYILEKFGTFTNLEDLDLTVKNPDMSIFTEYIQRWGKSVVKDIKKYYKVFKYLYDVNKGWYSPENYIEYWQEAICTLDKVKDTSFKLHFKYIQVLHAEYFKPEVILEYNRLCNLIIINNMSND